MDRSRELFAEAILSGGPLGAYKQFWPPSPHLAIFSFECHKSGQQSAKLYKNIFKIILTLILNNFLVTIWPIMSLKLIEKIESKNR